ncbi:hypothetical protein GA0061093_13225 [Rhodococcus qingshengii]|nr:hypothetical protein GA0061093_13225 [Rhodococcus qingshengii]
MSVSTDAAAFDSRRQRRLRPGLTGMGPFSALGTSGVRSTPTVKRGCAGVPATVGTPAQPGDPMKAVTTCDGPIVLSEGSLPEAPSTVGVG